MLHVYESVVTISRDILRLEGVEKVRDEEMLHTFEEELISTGKIPAKFLRNLHDIMKAKEDYDKNKLTKTEVDQVRKEANELIRFLVEYLQRKRGKELERAKIRVKYGNHFGEVLLLDTHAFIVHDIDAENSKVSKAQILENGGLGPINESTFEDFEKAISHAKFPPKVFIKQPIFEKLRELFGKDVEILVNY